MAQVFTLGKEVLKKIEAANYQAYFVGGCVRDLLLNRSIGDIDIATSATPKEIMELFQHVIPIGIEHGTVLVRYKKHSFEITTFRVDGTYSDNRHPDTVQYIDRIDEDLKRRDFTINALAMNYDGNIIDLFSGKQHIKEKIIRSVGNGYERFKEDPLRIIRALRFSSQLGFDIHEHTLAEIIQVKQDIEQIAVERITAEMTKFFAGEFVHKGIDYLLETAVYNHLPIFNKHHQFMKLLPKKMIPLHSFSEVIALFHSLQQTISVSQWSKAWKCSNKIKREATELCLAIRDFKQNGLNPVLVYRLPNHLFAGFVRITQLIFPNRVTNKQLMNMNDHLAIQSPQELQITGADLMNLYPHIKQGPWIKQMLTEIERLVLLSKLDNNKMKLKEWATCNPPEIN